MNRVDLGTVDMLIRVVLQKVTIGVDPKLVAQDLLPVRTYARQVLNVLIENIQLVLSIKNGFRHDEVVGRGDLDVLAVALDECNLMAIALHDRGDWQP